MQDYLLVIPARLGSTRLSQKPLVDISGKPMIARTIERAKEAVESKKIYVATDSELIADIAISEGVQATLTSDSCLTGTDRVAEFSLKEPADVYINLQGDEPMMSPENINLIINESLKDKSKIVNGWSWIKEEKDYRSRTIPKVVIRKNGLLMYMSRSPIPGTKKDEFKFSRKQVCVYSFPRKALADFFSQKTKTPHEDSEDIEILRFLEMGYEVQMIELDGNYKAVDTEDDLFEVRELYNEKYYA